MIGYYSSTTWASGTTATNSAGTGDSTWSNFGFASNYGPPIYTPEPPPQPSKSARREKCAAGWREHEPARLVFKFIEKHIRPRIRDGLASLGLGCWNFKKVAAR